MQLQQQIRIEPLRLQLHRDGTGITKARLSEDVKFSTHFLCALVKMRENLQERRKNVFVKKIRGSCERTRFHLLSHETSSVEKFSQLFLFFPSLVSVLVS